VDGRNVEPKLRLGREKQKPADAMHLDTRGGTKADVNPVAVLPDTKAMFRAANLEDRFAWTGDGDDQRGFHMRALGAKWILWTDQPRANRVAVQRNGLRVAAGWFIAALALRGVKGEHALGATQVGDAHGRELHAAQFLRRKGDRHALDATCDPVLAQDAPKG